MSLTSRLADLGIVLPQVTAPVASYVSAVVAGSFVYISGQLPMRDGAVVKGHLGHGVSIEEGQQAAQLCALGILAQLNAALDGDLDRVARCVKLTGFVACTADFTDHPKVINGASEFMLQAMGDAGKHARAAVGVASLPLGACVEVEAVFQLND